MKIVITGCTGFVGQQIVPALENAGADLLLVGRDTHKILDMFPGNNVATYPELPHAGQGYDLVLHLATLNNDRHYSTDEYQATNVVLSLDVLNASISAGVEQFLYVSSMHALDMTNMSAYAKSKRDALEALRKRANGQIKLSAVFLPSVYGRRWSGQLAPLNHFPHLWAQRIFQIVSAFRPVVHVDKIVAFLLVPTTRGKQDEYFIYDDKDQNLMYTASKRLLDLVFSVTVLLTLWWLLAVVWLAVRVQSKGPGIFAQRRVGRNGKAFTCYKFRTMAQGTRQGGTHEVGASSVTTIGRILRRTKLDEIPQVWNILRNEISLIGPRPCLPVQQTLIDLRAESSVLTMKPGISGYAQIHDVDMSDPVRLTRFDLKYKAMRSLLLDFRILIATLIGRGQGDRVRRIEPAEGQPRAG